MDSDREDLAKENDRLRKELASFRSDLHASRAVPQSSDQIYRSIFRLSPNIITVSRFEDGTFYDVNDAFCRIVGVSRQYALTSSSLGLNLWLDPKDRDRAKALLERDGAYENVEIGYQAADGRSIAGLQSAELVTIGNVRLVIAITTDITLQQQMEDQLRKTSRLESLGVLAGGIAHDFNNLLMGIQSNVEFASSQGISDLNRQEALEDVEVAVRHASDLTRQLRTFARGGAPIKATASAGELLEEVASFALRGSNVRFSIDVDEELAPSHEVRNRHVNDGAPLPLTPGPHVCLSIEDDGPGIAEADLPYIFDPFFSKRPAPRPSKSSQERFGNEKILVMDDNGAVRRAIQRVLSRQGYQVDVTQAGTEVLAAYEQAASAGAPYAVVLLDLTVPGGPDGKETARRLREIDPDARIVISSGYSDDAAMADPSTHGFDACITKPFDMEELDALLRKLLDGAS